MDDTIDKGYRRLNIIASLVGDSWEAETVRKDDKSVDYLAECTRYQFRADDLFPPT